MSTVSIGIMIFVTKGKRTYTTQSDAAGQHSLISFIQSFVRSVPEQVIVIYMVQKFKDFEKLAILKDLSVLSGLFWKRGGGEGRGGGCPFNSWIIPPSLSVRSSQSNLVHPNPGTSLPKTSAILVWSKPDEQGDAGADIE